MQPVEPPTDLHRLVDWFTECGVETVVMESTSVYWIPIFELLDAHGFTVLLVNARDAKHVPGWFAKEIKLCEATQY